MTIRPIDMQVVVAQQTNVSGSEQSLQNLAPQVQAQELQKIPDKTHERETQIEKSGEPNDIKVKEKEAEKRKHGKGGKKGAPPEQKTDAAEGKASLNAQEEGKGVRFDVTT